MSSQNAGGAATQAGINYQNRVAAWFAVRILADSAAEPLENLSVTSTLNFLRCETEQPVDDLMVGTSDNGHLFIQAKRSLNVESVAGSRFRQSITQFVRQFLAYRNAEAGSHGWERSLDLERDRIILVTSRRSSTPIRDVLPSVLRQVRSLDSDQPLDQCTNNTEEERVLETLLNSLSASWQETINADPTEAELRELLRLLRVLVLDVEEDDVAEREAKQLLRQSVLADVSQTDAAWFSLIQACSQFGLSRSGADREQLQQLLASQNIRLTAPLSYRDDIQGLRNYSRRTLESVSALSSLSIGDQTVKIFRASTQTLVAASSSNSLLVVGEPGAGKSGAIHDLVERLQNDSKDVVFFAVDRVEANSIGGLRNELALQHDLTDVLRNWPGEGPAFFVIDALDAARSDQSAQTLRALLEETLRHGGRWRVIASIRKFDLQYDSRLKKLFEGQPVSAEYRDQDFWNTRHLNIAVLSDDELLEACRQSPERLVPLFQSIFAERQDDLLTLLRNPFNLRLVGDLLGSGTAVETLTPIKTQMALLDRFWNERIILSRSPSQGDVRESVLRRTSEAMVSSRTLHVDRATLTQDTSASSALRDLQSSHVLAEWRPSPDVESNRYVITFAHHILFDYAVARLLLRGTAEALLQRLAVDGELAVAIRPSLMLHFRHEWERDLGRRTFWSLVFTLIHAEGIPRIGKLIGPTTAADLIKTVADFAPLIEQLNHPTAAMRDDAREALRHLAGAVQVTQGRSKLLGPHAGPWCELLDQAGNRIEETAYTIRPLLMRLCDLADETSIEQKAALGRVARRLLDFAWARSDSPDQYLIVHAIQAVCRTFDSDNEASAAIVRRSLNSEHLTNFAHIELPWLAREVENLVERDAHLVEDIYIAAFTHEEESSEVTEFAGGSRILPMISTRSQDFNEAPWLLAANYKKFLERSPVRATRALVIAIDAYVSKRQRDSERPGWTAESFDFNGHEAVITTDFSDIWDSGAAYRDDDPLRMLDTFESYLRGLSADETKAAERREILELVAKRNRFAVLWKRLLDLGAEAPKTLGLELRSLAWALPILTGFDTSRLAGNFLRHIFPLLDTGERELVERAILSITEAPADETELEGLQERRNRLLWCLPSESLVTKEALHVFDALRSQGGGPPNELRGPVSGVWTGQVTDEDILVRQGVPIEAEANRRIQDLIKPVQSFVATHQNAKPKLNTISEVLPNMQTLDGGLARAEEDGVHIKQKENGEAYLIEACERIAGSDEFGQSSEEVKRFTRRILLGGATNPSPEHRPENDRYFDENPSWGMPSPRVDAAGGLMWLAQSLDMADSEVLESIERLSNDDVPAVRFQIASRLNYVYYTAPDLMWRIIERMANEEQSRGVLEALLHVPLSILAGPHADRIVHLTQVIFERVRDGSGAAKIRAMSTRLFCGMYVWRDHDLARTIVFRIAKEPLAFANEAHKITFELRHPMTAGYVDVPNNDEDDIRRRSFALMSAILKATTNGLDELQARNKEAATWSEDDRSKAKTLFQLADSIAQELFFASGAFDKEMGERDANKPPLGDLEKRRFLFEALPLLEGIAEVGTAKVAHNLVKTLEHLLEYDPAQVFLTIARVVRASRKGQYEYESLAVDVIVGIVKRFLAAHRFLLRERPECRQALIEILDTFVAAGWPAAFELTYQLEEIYR